MNETCYYKLKYGNDDKQYESDTVTETNIRAGISILEQDDNITWYKLIRFGKGDDEQKVVENGRKIHYPLSYIIVVKNKWIVKKGDTNYVSYNRLRIEA